MNHLPPIPLNVNGETGECMNDEQFRLLTALQLSKMNIWDWDIINNRVVTSQNTTDLLGFVPTTFETFLSSVHPEDREKVTTGIQQALEGIAEYDMEIRIFGEGGTQHWLHAKGKVVRDESGRPVQMVGVGIQITDKKISQAALEPPAAGQIPPPVATPNSSTLEMFRCA